VPTEVNLAHVLAQSYESATGPTELDFHTGQIISWNSTTATNQVRVRGVTFSNLPVLTSAGSVGLDNGVTVGLLKVRTQYFILGRIVDLTSGLVNPQFPIVLYPQFISNGTAGTTGQYRVNTGVIATWEGRIRASFPYVEIDGVWGNISGAGSTTYALRLAGTVIGSWTETTLAVARRGPFEIRSFVGLDWAKFELAITVSTGTGEKALQPLGCYFRDSI
jgi:hypothetical protein